MASLPKRAAAAGVRAVRMAPSGFGVDRPTVLVPSDTDRSDGTRLGRSLSAVVCVTPIGPPPPSPGDAEGCSSGVLASDESPADSVVSECGDAMVLPRPSYDSSGVAGTEESASSYMVTDLSREERGLRDRVWLWKLVRSAYVRAATVSCTLVSGLSRRDGQQQFVVCPLVALAV